MLNKEGSNQTPHRISVVSKNWLLLSDRAPRITCLECQNSTRSSKQPRQPTEDKLRISTSCKLDRRKRSNLRDSEVRRGSLLNERRWSSRCGASNCCRVGVCSSRAAGGWAGGGSQASRDRDRDGSWSKCCWEQCSCAA